MLLARGGVGEDGNHGKRGRVEIFERAEKQRAGTEFT